MNNINLKPATKKETFRTGGIGKIHATYNELKEILGEPHDCTKKGEWESTDNKVRVEWAFLIDGKKELVFTIYDYKSRYPLNQIKQWSLGGKNKKVKDCLNKKLLVE